MALDMRGLEKTAKYLKRAKPQHPALVDRGHLLDELLGITNVPSGVWVDETGMIVRPPEPAFPEGSVNARAAELMPEVPRDIDPYLQEVLTESRKIRVDATTYIAGLRDWAAKGPQSRYALAPDEVVARSAPRPLDASLAAAHFELGERLHAEGHLDDAVGHFRAAHRLQPDNWTYKRDAWSMARRDQGPTDLYDGDWVSDVRRIGAENYYPPLDM